MGTSTEGFFGGAEFATPATFAATHGVPVETSTSPTEPIPIDEGTHIGEASEVTTPLVETSSVQKGATPPLLLRSRLPWLCLSLFPSVTPSRLYLRL